MRKADNKMAKEKGKEDRLMTGYKMAWKLYKRKPIRHTSK